MNSFEDLFNKVKKEVDVTDVARDTWISSLKPLRLNGNTAMLYTPQNFVKQLILDNYLDKLEQCFSSIIGVPTNVMIQSDDDLTYEQRTMITPIPELQDDVEMLEKINKTMANGIYRYTFDTFIEGESNRLAYSACKNVAEGKRNYNPLYIYGDPGLGKTHLLSAVKNEVSANQPNLNIIFTTAEDFLNEFVQSIKLEKTMSFKNKYRSADILLIDDVQFFAGKKECQQELFATFNELHQNGRQIILTSDRSPKEINDIDKRLQSRFEWGLLADIQIPEFETRLTIVKRMANLLQIQVSNSILEFLADKLKENIRQLEGAVNKLSVVATLHSEQPTIAMARDIVNEVLDEKTVPAPLTVERVINEVANTYGLTGDEIRSKKRSADISTARQIAIYAVHKITGLSYVEIGKQFGGRDHSTIVYAINKVKNELKKEKAYRNAIEDLIKNVESMR